VQCLAAAPWAPQAAVNAVISLICARYGALAIGWGAGGIRYRASHQRGGSGKVAAEGVAVRAECSNGAALCLRPQAD
jgi:hypothetical protein